MANAIPFVIVAVVALFIAAQLWRRFRRRG
jgi:hypothetical protein